jgi:hypothetical protein
MKALWSAYKIPIIITATVVGLALVVTYQWGYIKGQKSNS